MLAALTPQLIASQFQESGINWSLSCHFLPTFPQSGAMLLQGNDCVLWHLQPHLNHEASVNTCINWRVCVSLCTPSCKISFSFLDSLMHLSATSPLLITFVIP